MEVPASGEYKLGYYNDASNIESGDTRNGSPHIFNLGKQYVGTDPVDIGVVTLPRAYPVDLRVLKPSGEPLMGARTDYRHSGWGASGRLLALNTEGYTVIDGATHTGLEFAEHVTAEVKPPAGDEYDDGTYKHTVTVDRPTELTVTIGADGAKWQVERGERGTTETTTDSGTTATTTRERTTRETTSRRTTPPGTAQTTREVPVNATTRRGTREGNESSAKSERGFFSNGTGTSDLEMLNDPFVLTVGGFVLSAAGIAHQLVRGY
ncbi:hypothetical protein [Halorussus caseinilyticus]|uniref:Uncharacterized protein n=1 Tax=Halorussus caseinilyticus TaxID=3034025 RepID=A0ABD5WMP8_9EURY|nr:hypothetical protein [Halorussus sp. DT72]